MATVNGHLSVGELEEQAIGFGAASLSIKAESMEADLARDLPAVDLNNHGIITDRLGRIAETLGLRRTPRPTDAKFTLSAISHSRIRAERQSGGQE